jgi:hypothetical protein
MNFMVLAGFDQIPVEAHAMAENVLKRLDVAIAYDNSGSMNDDTYCFKCFNERNPDNYPPPSCYGCYDATPGKDYPDGERMYLPYPNEFCESQEPVVHRGYDIVVAEAEWFSNSTSVAGGRHDYDRDTYEDGTTFWMLQRVESSQASGHSYEKNDQRGAHLMHMPTVERTLGHLGTDEAPRLDYNLNLPTPGYWYIWIRAQCGPWPGGGERADSCMVHWGANNGPIGRTSPADFGVEAALTPGYCLCHTGPCDCRPPQEGGNRGNRWMWVRLGAVSVDTSELQVNLWGGGTGFRLDKLLLTRNPEGPDDAYPDRAPSFIRDTTPTWKDVRQLMYQSYEDDGRYGGPPDTGGRNGLACDICSAYYGGSQEAGCDKTQDDIFDDAQPIRSAKESAKSFVKRLRARFDQVAFVDYATDSSISRELNCVWKRNVPPVAYGLGIWTPGKGPDKAWTWCFDHRTGEGGVDGPPVNVPADGSVIYAIDSLSPGNWTNMPEGLANAIEVLQPTPPHNGRPFAARYIILMTDGVPNRWPGFPDDHECFADPELWIDSETRMDESNARDCTIYYAQQAESEGIAIFTIGLGVNVDEALLQEVARLTGGVYFGVTNRAELDEAYEQIANRMILRLVE